MYVTCPKCNGNPEWITSVLNAKIICDACNGKGGFEIPDDKKLCPVCNGSRKVFKPGTAYRYKCECKNCDGKGYVDK